MRWTTQTATRSRLVANNLFKRSAAAWGRVPASSATAYALPRERRDLSIASLSYTPQTASGQAWKQAGDMAKAKKQAAPVLKVTATHAAAPPRAAAGPEVSNNTAVKIGLDAPPEMPARKKRVKVKAESAGAVDNQVSIAEEAPKPRKHKKTRTAAFAGDVEDDKPKRKRNYANAYTQKGQGFSALVDSLAFEGDAAEKPSTHPGAQIPLDPPRVKEEPEAGDQKGTEEQFKPKRKTKKRAESKAPNFIDAAEVKKPEAARESTELLGAPKRSRRRTTKIKLAEVEVTEVVNKHIKPVPDETLIAAPKRQRKRRQADPNAPPPFEIPSVELLEEALKTQHQPRPVPNLGFACLNATLRAQKPAIFSNRDCIKKTWEGKGIEWISHLALENSKALPALILWNHLNGIRFFRLSSKIFPWCTEWDFKDLPQRDEIADTLAFAGKLANAYDQRLTFHPSHFVKLGCEDGPLLDRSLKEMEVHSLIFDLMGYEPSPVNKINIHIGGMYGDKQATMGRFVKNFKRLSPNCQKRLTLENDDWANSYSITDLLTVHKRTGIPLVFDFHHHRFCPGGLSEEEAFKAAVATWPEGIRPVVHWSESQEGRRPSAHSDFVTGPLRLYGLHDQVDVMIEAKGKELALLRLRDPAFTPSAAALATISDE